MMWISKDTIMALACVLLTAWAQQDTRDPQDILRKCDLNDLEPMDVESIRGKKWSLALASKGFIAYDFVDAYETRAIRLNAEDKTLTFRSKKRFTDQAVYQGNMSRNCLSDWKCEVNGASCRVTSGLPSGMEHTFFVLYLRGKFQVGWSNTTKAGKSTYVLDIYRRGRLTKVVTLNDVPEQVKKFVEQRCGQEVFELVELDPKNPLFPRCPI